MSDEKKISHPSFGMIGLSQVSSSGTPLVGSSVIHHNYLSITISEATKYVSPYHEHFFGEKPLVEVQVSHAQLAEFLFSVNQGSGVPCTIHWVKGEKEARPAPPFESPFKQSRDDLNEVLDNTLAMARKLAKEAQELIKGGLVRKKERDELAFLAMKIVQDIDSNIKFAAECMDKKVEKNIAHAKVEIESFIDMKARMIGLASMQGEIISLPKETEEKP